ncbi:hypothetical protein Fot_14546 [Forsythia ovata]|uniref:Uncharacterized protein n=1 Tax=Forsythia ovata TaxID=205694 RepID=A0ABD1W965_9LAMI
MSGTLTHAVNLGVQRLFFISESAVVATTANQLITQLNINQSYSRRLFHTAQQYLGQLIKERILVHNQLDELFLADKNANGQKFGSNFKRQGVGDEHLPRTLDDVPTRGACKQINISCIVLDRKRGDTKGEKKELGFWKFGAKDEETKV